MHLKVGVLRHEEVKGIRYQEEEYTSICVL